MTESRFSELVNLFFDQEISSVELAELEAVLQSSPVRRGEFEARRKLQRAMIYAMLSPEERARLEGVQAEKVAVRAARPKLVKAGLVAIGLAAGVVVGISLNAAYLVHQSETLPGNTVASFEETLSDILVARYERLERLQSEDTQVASIAAQLRLLGLRPELAGGTVELRAVDVAALASVRAARQREIQRLRSAPSEYRLVQPEIFESRELRTGSANDRFTSGFEASLVGFK
mgnify:CR=1 FL=1